MCGEEFIREVHRMFEEFDAFQEPSNHSALSNYAAQMLDSSEPKKLLEDFAHMLKQQATFFLAVKAGD